MLTAILIAVGLTIIYSILAPRIMTGSYSGLVILYGGIGLFFGSIIFYFLFTYFRELNKLHWLFIGIVVFAVFSILVNGGTDVLVKNLLNKSNLPKQYAKYQDIKRPLIQFENKTMELVIDGHNELEYYITAQEELIVSKAIPDNIDTAPTYFKFDRLGNIKDKFRSTDAYQTFFEGYLINESDNCYSTWAFDGDTAKRKMEIHNENVAFSQAVQEEFSAQIEKNATLVFSKDAYTATRKKVKKIFYWQNNKWNVFYCDEDNAMKIANKGTANNDLFRYYDKESYAMLPKNNSNIEYQYFQKIKLESSDENGGVTKKVWNGYLYSNIIIDRDTLKIKEALTMDDKWKTQQLTIKGETVGDLSRQRQFGFLPYLYFSSPKLGYQLFTNDLSRLYIIKNK